MEKEAKIYIAGHRGLVGSAIIRKLSKLGYKNLITRPHCELNLTNQNEVNLFFQREKPDYVFLAAAKVGGIYANDTYPADFIRDNLQIQTNVIDSAWKNNVKKLQFLGSSCIYPKFTEQPISEDSLLTGSLEPTNEWYAIAKIAGIKMCQAYRRQYDFKAISLMPTNLYGIGDNFHPTNSHVLPGLIRRFDEAKKEGKKEVIVWGTGTPKREFINVDDLADAAIFLMENYDSEEIINVGVGEDISIADLAKLIKEVVGFEGELKFDTSKPDGTPRKLLNISRLKNLGWSPKISLEEGIKSTYLWFLENLNDFRG